MGINLRLPNMAGTSEREQLSQLKACLFQWAEQLNLTLNNLGSGATTTVERYISKNTLLKESSSSVIDATTTFNAIKGLIIKSADIVNALYYETNRRLFGEYGALSDYGEFKEQTMQEIEETSKSTTQNFTNIQQLNTTVENINFTLAEVNAYLKSGELDVDANGVPIYGLEIGQKNSIDGTNTFKKFARFTADRLSFYDQNDTEVAYISDYKLYISNVEITVSLQTGGYVDIVTTGGGVITKWVGRG